MTSIPLSELEASAAAKFDNIGDKYVGVITGMKQQQQTDLDGKPKVFASGDPMMLWVITIQPEQGDVVSLWAKGGRYTPAKGSGDAMLPAIAAAVRAASATSVEVGGLLAVAYTGESEAKTGMNPAKLYTAQYQAPVEQPKAVAVDDLFSS